MGSQGFGVDPLIAGKIAGEVKEVHELGVEVAIVIGGGNIFRGLSATAQGMERVSGDLMGMLATVINAIALQDALEKMSVYTRVVSAIEMREVAEVFHSYGLTVQESTPIVEALAKHPQKWVDFMMRFELGLEKPDPKRAFISAFTIAFGRRKSGRPLADWEAAGSQRRPAPPSQLFPRLPGRVHCAPKTRRKSPAP